MIEQGQRRRYTFCESHLGTNAMVLFEQQHVDGNWTGYTANYMNVEVNSSENLHNKLLPVTFIGITERSIVGKLKE